MAKDLHPHHPPDDTALRWRGAVALALLTLVILGFSAVASLATTPATTPATAQTSVYSKSNALWGSTCWTCDFISAANNARKVYGRQAFDLVASNLVPLITAILGVWILVQAGRLLMPFGAMDGGAKTMTSVFARIILSIIALSMVRNYDFFWKLNDATISAGLDGSHVIIDRALTAFGPGNGFGSRPDGCTTRAAALSGGSASTTPISPPPTATAADLLAPLEENRDAQFFCTLHQMQSGLGVGMDIGIGMLMDVVRKPFWAILQGVGGIPVIVGAGIVTGGESTWVLMRMVAGFVLMAIFGLASFLMAFRFIDVIVRWTVLTVLAPAYISLFVFPKTRQIAFGGLKMMLSDALTLIFMAIIIAVMISFFGYVLSPDSGLTQRTMQELSETELKKGIGEPVFWYMLTIGLMTIGLLSQAAAWASYAVSMPAMMQLPNFGARAADAIQSAAGQLAPQIGGILFNRQWRSRVRMNSMLRSDLVKPHDYATRKAQNRLLAGEK